MNLQALARLLRGQVSGPSRLHVPGPGHTLRDRSLSVLLHPSAPDGFWVHSFAGDDWRLCREHVRAAIGLPALEPLPLSRNRPLPSSAPSLEDRIGLALRLWETAVPIACTPAAIYLLRRGVGLPAEVLQGSVLRYHGACPFRLDNGSTVKLPAMLGAIVDVRTNAFRGVHRTALKPDGSGKADHPGLGSPKRMLGSVRGACVKLSTDDEVTFGLHIAEGIETALSCMAMGFRPIWAALSAGGVARFPVLSGIEAVTIMADNDASGTGLSAARDCARRWVAGGREAIVLARSQAGLDWADQIGREG